MLSRGRPNPNAWDWPDGQDREQDWAQSLAIFITIQSQEYGIDVLHLARTLIVLIGTCG